MEAQATKTNRNTTNLIVDIAIFIAFLVAMAPHFTGMAVHEWLGLAFGGTIVTHLLLHWQWLVEVTKRFFGKAQWSARINYLLNAALFIDLTAIIFTGVMISESALPALGLELGGNGWRGLHATSANLFLPLIGLHVALHWQWIANMIKRYVVTPLLPARAPQRPVRTPPAQPNA